MSASAIADALITMYSAASAFGTDCGKTYKVLETSSGSSCVVSWTGLEARKVTMSGGTEQDYKWTFSLEVFVKDSGAPTADLGRNIEVADAVISPVFADQTLLGTVDEFVRLTGSCLLHHVRAKSRSIRLLVLVFCLHPENHLITANLPSFCPYLDST